MLIYSKLHSKSCDYLYKQMQMDLALTSFQLMKMSSKSGLYLCRQKENLIGSSTPGSGLHICSDHFTGDNYEGFCAGIAGF